MIKSTLTMILLSGFCFLVTAQHKKKLEAPTATAIEDTLPFFDIPDLEEAYINPNPNFRKDGISVGELGKDFGNKGMILELAKEIADGKHGNFDSFLIAHQDKLLFESYYLHGRIDLPHPQASATKAYTALALGRAIQLGYLTMDDLDKPLINFLNNLDSTTFVGGVDKITLQHALTMRSGIRITEEQRKEFKKNPKKLKGQGLIQTWFEHTTPILKDSQTFKYSWDPIFVTQVLEAAVPGTAEEFIKNELLDKMGITNYGWRTNGDTGQLTAGWGSSMTSRAMIKWGTLAMNDGKWNGEQLIPKAFIKKATSRIFITEGEKDHYFGKDVSNQGYGYYFWSADLNVGNKNYLAISAQGGFGQFITLIKELDLLIVHTAHSNETPYLQLIAERIIPAFIKDPIAVKESSTNIN